jgi:hypothetical protein
MMRSLTILLAVLFSIAVILPNAALAGDWIKQGDEWLTISGGVFISKINSTLSVDSSSLGEGADVDLENDLDLGEDTTTYWGNIAWRFKKKHRLSLGYFQFNRDAKATAKDDLQIGDEIYPAGASLSTEFKIGVLPIAYSYSFIKKEKYEFGGTLGLHWSTLSFGVAGSASLGDLDADADVSADAAAPMPLIGLLYDYYVTPKWTVGTHGEIFFLDISDNTFAFSGTITNLRVHTEYWLFNNVGLGAAVNWFALDVEIGDSDWKGGVDYQYLGLQLFASVRF